MIRILLVDDQATVRQGWRMRFALEPDIDVVAEACDGLQAVQLAQALQPDAVLLDLEMPRMDGITAAEQIATLLPGSVTVVVSIYDSVENRRRAKAAGAAAFFGKQEPMETVLAMIRGALDEG